MKRSLFLRTAIAGLFIGTLAACGGGGGSSSTASAPAAPVAAAQVAVRPGVVGDRAVDIFV